MSGAYQGLHEPLHDVPRNIAKLGIEGIIWYRRHIEGLPVPNGDDIYSLFGEATQYTFLRWLGEVLSSKTPELFRAPVAAAMYVTFNANETGARTFWGRVARGGVEFDDNAPESVLDRWLRESKEVKDPRRRLKPGNYYQGCIFAWTAFRQDASLKSIKYDFSSKGFHEVVH